MTPYEIVAICLSSIAIIIPIAQWAWKRWAQKPILNYHPNGTARLLFNQSGSYLQIDGVYEAINKPISVKNISVCVKRQRDNETLNLTWSTFISPVIQRVAGNAVQTNETAHPFRIEANSIMCAFTEFADAFNSYAKTFKTKTEVLFNNIPNICKEAQNYNEALQKYQTLSEYTSAKSFVESEFFWEIGKYDVVIQARYDKKTINYLFEFSVGQADYQQINQNIDESLISPLKDAHGIMRNYQFVDVELKEKTR